MSKKYVYTEGSYVHVLPEGTVIFNETGVQNTSQYFDANNTIINDCTINESYNTAIGSDNETQYLSILESDAAELTLEDLSNLTIDGEDVSSILLFNNNSPPNVIEEKTTEETKNDNPDMVVFTMEGSDDLHGIQLMQDESGQMQKYQFKFRQTAEGQLEPIPESVTLLPNDEESELPVEPEVEKSQSNIKEESCYLAMTEIIQQDSTEDIVEQDKAPEQIIVKSKGEEVLSKPQTFEDEVHTSVAARTDYGIPSLAQIKKEHYLETIEECDEIDQSCDMEIGPVEIRNEQFEQINNLSGNENVEPDLDVNEGQVFQHFMAPSYQVEVEYETEVEATECLSNLKNKVSEGQLTKDSKENNPSKISDYKFDGTETLLYQNRDSSVKPRFENHIVLKDPKIKRQTISNPKYYVVYPEKENLMAVSQSKAIKTHQTINKTTKSMKPNSRSVLRSSVVKNQEKQVVAPVKSVGSDCDINLKRFSKNKDALLAKRFHNFLNRTTIPQAPVRQKRQPRKQEIKPIVERSREEIIVQEVLISSNGFVESFDRNCDVGPLRVTAIVELSDSDDEKTSKSFKRKTNQKRKFDQSVIEIHSDEEPVSNPIQTKGTSHLKPKKLDHPPPRAKRKKVQSKVETTSEFLLKKEVICPYCPKTFPSQNSLNTHIIHHNLENSLKNKTKMSINTHQSMFAKPEYKHKCEECQATFRNKILLEKHQCTKKQNPLTCSVCLKQFRDMTVLNIHKKSHAKANLIKTTTLTKVSPRKSYSKLPSTSKKPLVESYKCSECPKVCDTESKLSAHVKIHRKFVCTFCSVTFASKVMLDSHIRSNCVKNKRMSYTIKKPFVHTPSKRLSISSVADMSLNQSTLGMKMNCDKCSMKFGTFRSLYTHKVQKHGMSTPDKTLLSKPKGGVRDAKSAHGGVPANPRLQQAFAVMRKKLAEAGNLTVK